ncbi:DUF4384 domain-containing protein [Ferrimonas balearica]|uniref:DUF4384 domain-containing protein n=1 Tax=Ferrimonas balearica TaxID=44012 RepID=UPI001C98C9E7|nr:DUF4384 domain-containing protein [Ferrimonas balearica]MBY6223390.1 DUF4384 domain-containing protein [Ferrimonas balearica]
MKRIALTALLTLALPAQAATLWAESQTECGQYEGRQACREAAEQAVLASLSKQIFVQVESSGDSFQNSDGVSLFTLQSRTHSNLPLIGVSQQCDYHQDSQLVSCSGSLNPDEVLPSYAQRIDLLNRELHQGVARLKSQLSDGQYQQLLELLTLQQQLEQFRLVHDFFAPQPAQLPSLGDHRALLQTQLAQYNDALPTLALASERIVADLKPYQGILVRPPLYPHSQQVTEFGQRIANQLQQGLASQLATSRDNARYLLTGNYQPNGQGIDLLYSLVELDSGDVLHTQLVTLRPQAYQGLSFEPASPDFERLLYAGYVEPSALTVDLQTNKGSRALGFAQGETVQLMVKLNRSGYFYVLGHTGDEQGFSYLLELNDETGPHRFQHYIGPEQANKWVLLGEFEVEPPFGYEMLQVIASNQPLDQALPATRYDPKTGYHRVGASREQAVGQTRGLKRITQQQDRVLTAEALLSFTSTPRL